jgi:hypothetical protein
MTQIAHIRIGTPTQIIKVFGNKTGFSRLEDGRRMDISQAPIGYQIGDDKLVAYTLVENDTSTGPDTVRTDTGDVVDPDDNGVTRTITIRDMTQAELDVRTEEQVQNASDKLDNRHELIALASAIWHVKKGTQPAEAFDSPAKYKAWLRTLL